MHKSERLFQLVNLLKGRRVAITAKQLAERLAVSERTIYRDIANLQSSGVPVEGEPGIGYLIGKCDLPPMMFTLAELQALLLGSRMASAYTDPELAANAQAAISKIEAVLPTTLKQQIDEFPFLVAAFNHGEHEQACSQQLRQAVTNKLVATLDYSDVNQQVTHRIVEPLGLVYWGAKWTLIAYCQLRLDYREFRLDRIIKVAVSDNHFEVNEQKCLAAYIEIVKARYANSESN
jgi:predicted DNA-binding transcriptional regulator YafY